MTARLTVYSLYYDCKSFCSNAIEVRKVYTISHVTLETVPKYENIERPTSSQLYASPREPFKCFFYCMRCLLSAKPYTLGSSFVCLRFLYICGGKLWRWCSPRRCVTPVGFRPGNSWPFLLLIHVHAHKHAVLPTLPICIPAMSLLHCLALAWHSVCPCVWLHTMNWVFETSQKEIWMNRIIVCWTVRDIEKWAK